MLNFVISGGRHSIRESQRIERDLEFGILSYSCPASLKLKWNRNYGKDYNKDGVISIIECGPFSV